MKRGITKREHTGYIQAYKQVVVADSEERRRSCVSPHRTAEEQDRGVHSAAQRIEYQEES